MRKIVFNEKNIILDSGYFFGKGVFETILVKKKPIFLKEHIERLNNGIKALGLGDEVLIQDIIKIINKYSIKNCVLKIAVSEKNMILEVRDNKYKSEEYLRGFTLKISNVNKNSNSKLNYIKSINYLENIIEKEEAMKNGYDEVIFLNEKGFVTEGSMSNIFIIKGEKIYTPNIKSGLLPGVVRKFIIENFDAIEKEITIDDLLDADELFITNSLLGIMGVSKLEDKIFNESKITIRVIEKYELSIDD